MAVRPVQTTIYYDSAGKVGRVEHVVVHEVQANFDRGKGLEKARLDETLAVEANEISAGTRTAVAALIDSVQSDIDAL